MEDPRNSQSEMLSSYLNDSRFSITGEFGNLLRDTIIAEDLGDLIKHINSNPDNATKALDTYNELLNEDQKLTLEEATMIANPNNWSDFFTKLKDVYSSPWLKNAQRNPDYIQTHSAIKLAVTSIMGGQEA